MTPTKNSSSSSSRQPLCFFDAFVLHLAGALIGVEQVEHAFLYNNDPSNNNDVCQQQRLYWKSPLLCRNNDVVSSMLLAAPGGQTTTSQDNDHPHPNNLNDDSSNNNSQNQAPSTSPSTIKAEEKGQKKQTHSPCSSEELPLFWDISMTFSATAATDDSSSPSCCQIQFGVFYPQSGYHRTVPWTEEMLLTHVRQMGFLHDDGSSSSSFRPNDLAKALADGFLQSSSIPTTASNGMSDNNNSSLDHGKIVISKTTTSTPQQQEQQVALNFSWWYPKLESRGHVTALPVQTIATSLESSLLLECILQVGGFLDATTTTTEPNNNKTESSKSAVVTHNPYARQKQKPTAADNDKQKRDVNEAVVTTWKARIERQRQQQQLSSGDSGNNKSSSSSLSPSTILHPTTNATAPVTKKLKMLPGKGRGKRLGGKIQFLGQQQQQAASHKK